jgi:anti-sigma factor RsiW
MECPEFLACSTEWLDKQIPEGEDREMEDHLAGCAECRQYQSTLSRGLKLLRAMPPLEVPSDFHPRLTHRIFHVEDDAEIARESLGSGATTVAVMAVAALMALAAWTPMMGTSPVAVELPAIVVLRPPASSFTPRHRARTFSRQPSLFTTADYRDGIWGDTHQTLFEYSTLSHRRRGRVLSAVGLQ